ncbi:putative 5-dehydro-4-deoxyglucarate dehydratase 2 [Nocardiopsis terrae]|uniref:Probable 5-dehydro-4-deoxyglucarate dehydratase n=1 Tax=Nocardiopsis terrae TaxID=372655 RepID=A0ABR9HHB7_9ACTN|nr:5-dehydro-4-deoxyglucarate dehydratase [Nocardiopsis terrae]MBE1458423.1 5-dehydro-4-deoxyglucarate dehydratase [Nocardiopsis terrae]GHC80564.1 putative 5-dehydro-4-deoxyglucarate dehydratase 2 [Nocardiopsis terrae]
MVSPVERPEHVAEVAQRLSQGMDRSVLAFPLTPFDQDGGVDLKAFEAHLEHQLAADPGALFVACGTGEYFSLDLDEHEALVSAAVRVADGRIPVVAGAGHGTPLASAFARSSERAGADAVLLLPPYLVNGPQAGLVEHTRRVCAATRLPVIAYQRSQVSFTPESLTELSAIPNLVGVKDGHGDLDQMQRLVLAAPEGFLFFNGVPTAELQARSYAAIGVSAYSSAIHAVAPEISHAFHAALGRGDDALVDRLLNEFFVPWVRLRDRGTGYAVSLVKAAAQDRADELGYHVGPVRPPLAQPAPEHLAEARTLIRAGLEIVR